MSSNITPENPAAHTAPPEFDEWRKEAERLAMDFAHAYAFAGDDTMPKAKAALLAHLSAVPFNQVVQEPIAWTDPHYMRVPQLGGSFSARYTPDPIFTTPLYAQPVSQPGEALPAEQPKSDKSYPVVAVGEINKTALPGGSRA